MKFLYSPYSLQLTKGINLAASANLYLTRKRKTVELEQSNQEVIIESIPTNETLIAKDKIDDINDVATWPEVITHYMRVEMVKAGPERYQNKERPFKPAITVIKEGDKEKESLSFLSMKWFYRTLKNGDEIFRSWLLYSNSYSGLYCFCCKMFQSRNDNSQFVSKPFVNFWHLNQCVFKPENSKIHNQCFDKWKELALRLQLQQKIDKEMQDLMDKQKNKGREIQHSVVEVIKFLCKQNLPLRGHREDPNSRNQENFLETLKLLQNILQSFKKYLSVIQLSSKSMTTYLSPTIQNELIELLGKKVKHLILEEIKAAKYFSILLDSIPDVSHTDQMALIVRYVKVDSSEVQIKESFLNFFQLHRKNADEIT